MDKKTMAFYFGFLYDKLLSQKTKVLTTENRDGIITNSELIDPYDFNLPQFGLSTGMSYGISLKKLNLSTHLRYNLQGLTADSMLKKDGKFDFEFRRANVLNRLSLAFAVQLQWVLIGEPCYFDGLIVFHPYHALNSICQKYIPWGTENEGKYLATGILLFTFLYLEIWSLDICSKPAIKKF